MQKVWQTEDGFMCTSTIDPYDELPPRTNEPERVDHPSHYNHGKIEVIDFIEDQKLGFALGNAVKYICRCRYKDNMLEDLKKARWYIDHCIKELEYDDEKDDQD